MCIFWRSVSFELHQPDAHGERPHRRTTRCCVCAKVWNMRRFLAKAASRDFTLRTRAAASLRGQCVTQRLGAKPPCRTLASRFGRMCLPLAWPNGRAQRPRLRLRLRLKLRPSSLLLGRPLVFPSLFKAHNHVVCLPCPLVHSIMSRDRANS